MFTGLEKVSHGEGDLKIQKERAVKIDHGIERHNIGSEGRGASFKEELGYSIFDSGCKEAKIEVQVKVIWEWKVVIIYAWIHQLFLLPQSF